MRKHTLVPFHAAERISVKEAAVVAGKSDRTIRLWCEAYGIGRRVADGVWAVSKVALQMHLEGDVDALKAYRDDGLRASSEPVARYYERADLGYLLDQRDFHL